ncbi:MAG: polymerase III subunit beta protein [Parcubacteria group bacterium GW2011_GWC1_41_7]|nr:MAG: polymerase III subunit beta protein [Parcubacteria group bacterium GW2011_GWC1_41_7]
MKLQIIKNSIIDIVHVVDKICSRKSDLNILNFFKLSAENDRIFLFATDLEISYFAEVSGKIEENGEALIPAKQFSQLLSNFYEDVLFIEKNDNSLVIKGDYSLSSLPGLIDEEYPLISTFKKDHVIEIETEIFDEYLEKVYAPLKTADIFKPELSGVYIHLQGNFLYLVSTDTIRLTETKIKKQFFETNMSSISALIPKRILEEYRNIKRKPIKIFIYIEDHQITFDLGSQILTTKRVAIEFPDYKRVIPETFGVSVYIKTEDFIKSLKLTKVFLDQTKELKIKVIPDAQKLELYTKNDLLGESENSIQAEFKESSLQKNEHFVVSFNHEFLLDGVLAADGEKIFLGLTPTHAEGARPLLIKSPLEDNFIYILMPL